MRSLATLALALTLSTTAAYALPTLPVTPAQPVVRVQTPLTQVYCRAALHNYRAFRNFWLSRAVVR